MPLTSPLVMVIFGATGDLSRRKIFPAIEDLRRKDAIGGPLYFIGVGRSILDTKGLPFEKTVYVQGDFADPAIYQQLVKILEGYDKEINACVPRFFYLATPPQHYETILTHLHASKLSEGCGQGTTLYTKVLIEKPFGRDLKTARRLDLLLGSIFEERQIYRIDHYLGKETVQNILSFRFANGIFEPTWNREFIDHVQITLSEVEGVGNRGEFYDGVGALRDVVQNHMIEMMALVAMDQPKAFDAQSIRDERVKMIQAITCIEPKNVSRDVVRGQYEGYTKERNVDSNSTTETFVALKLLLNTPRWKGVPFYLRTGKRLPKKITEISIHYKKPAICTPIASLETASAGVTGAGGPSRRGPLVGVLGGKRMAGPQAENQVCLFPEPDVMRNVLAIRVEPDEGIALRLMAKKPGFTMNLTPVEMEFTYKQAFASVAQPTAYERLLLDAIRGDQTLFARTDGIEASWTLVTKILKGWGDGGVARAGGPPPAGVPSVGGRGKPATGPLYSYTSGSWGPKEAEDLIERDGRHWFLDED